MVTNIHAFDTFHVSKRVMMEYSIPWLDRRAEERKNTTVVERQRCMS